MQSRLLRGHRIHRFVVAREIIVRLVRDHLVGVVFGDLKIVEVRIVREVTVDIGLVGISGIFGIFDDAGLVVGSELITVSVDDGGAGLDDRSGFDGFDHLGGNDRRDDLGTVRRQGGRRRLPVAVADRVDDEQQNPQGAETDADPGDHLVAGDHCGHQRGEADHRQHQRDDQHRPDSSGVGFPSAPTSGSLAGTPTGTSCT